MDLIESTDKTQADKKFKDFPGMARRNDWVPELDVEPQQVDWQKLLTLKELYCVVGNQLISHVQTQGTDWPENHSLGVGHTKNEGYHYTSGEVKPGLECVEFYPLVKGDVHGGEMDILPACVKVFDKEGNCVEPKNDLDLREWKPDLQKDVFKYRHSAFLQQIACADDILVCRMTPLEGNLPEYFEISCDFGGTAGVLDIESGNDQTFVWGQENEWSDTVFGLWCNKPLKVIEISNPGEPIHYRLKGLLGDELVIAYSAAYLMSDLKARMKGGLRNPAAVFEKSTAFWNDYFTRMVPYFNCSDISYVKQYYYTFFCLRANVWDIPFEPLFYPYTCTSKLIWKWSWPWNSMFDNISLRWLNDKSLAEGNVLQEFYLGRSMMEDPVLKEFPDLLPSEDKNTFPVAYGNLTHNTSIYDAIWMTYLTTGNKAWLRKLYPALKTHYDEILLRCNPGGLAGWGLDEWDISARVRAFNPDTLIDSSCFLLSGTCSLSKIAGELGEKDDERRLKTNTEILREKIQELLWDDSRKIFLDANIKEGEFSPIKTAASFEPLYCGAATEEQAEYLVRHLTDPSEFWTPYPLPAFSIDTPEFKPDADNIGNGPIPPISCGWFQIQGLMDYGYTDVAVELIRRQMKMNTLNGVSSAVKFNPLTGEGLQFFVSRKEDHSLCTMNATIVDLVIRYVVGFQPREDGLIEFNPVALDCQSRGNLEWGPFKYCELSISMKWNSRDGMVIKCNDALFTTPSVQHVILIYDGNNLLKVV